MHRTEIDRRAFACGLAAFLVPAGAGGRSAAGVAEALLAATVRRPDGSYAAVLYDLQRQLLNSVALPARGHDIAVNPMSRELVAFARRPGTFAVTFSGHRAHAPTAFSTPEGRHFYGHGVFSRDGRLLYTTENDFANARGCIGVWETAGGYRRIGEFASHGTGPHDLGLLSDGRTLVIANGGLITHPAHGRAPLNLASMRASLTYVDRLTGELLERNELPLSLRRSSIRHLGVGQRDTVIFGCQFMGAKTERVDLIGFHRPGEEIELLASGHEMHRALRSYVSSVAVDRGGEIAGVTSSRGNGIVRIDIAKRRVLDIHALPDVSGIAAGGQRGELLVTSGTGIVAGLAEGGPVRRSDQLAWSWDNHAVGLTGGG
jgi:hypothetical protein